MACIGMGNQGMFNLPKLLNLSACQVLAVCDVNRGSYGYKEPGDFRGREPAKQMVEQHYAKQKGVGQYRGLRYIQRFPRSARPPGYRRRDDRDARSLARADDDRRGRSWQGHLLREAVGAHHCGSAANDRSSAKARAGAASRHPRAIQPDCAEGVRAGAQRRDRRSETRGSPCRPAQQDRARAGMETDAGARRFRLRAVAWPGTGRALSQGSLPVQLPLHLRLRGRPGDQFRRPFARHGPVGSGNGRAPDR